MRAFLVVLVAFLAVQAGAAAAGPRKVIIDDDGFGLMHVMLLNAPEIEVIGLTSVSGNVWANRATAEALRGLELTGRSDVPVAAGATFPLVNTEAATERWEARYGRLTWKGAWMRRWVEPTRQRLPDHHGPDDPVTLPWDNPVTRAGGEPAASFLVRMVRRYPGEITIVATGPMTNIALAQRIDPAFARLARELVYMGGSLAPRQVLDNVSAAQFAREFVNSPRREFNARFDPEAASIVARAPWRRITAVPVDPTTATQLTPALIARLAKAAPALAPMTGAMQPGFPLWDEIVAGVLLDPAIVTRRERLFIDYDTGAGAGYGDTLSWHAGYQPGLGEQEADVVEAIDVPRLEALMVRLVGGTGR